MNGQEREEMLDRMQREVFAPENDDPRNVQLREQQAEIDRLRAENEQLHHEISYYESLSNDDPNADWPHRDGRYRDWLQKQLQAARAAGGK